MASNGILLTGATGFLGGELLPRLLAARPEATIYCLIRGRAGIELEARRRAVLDWGRVPAEDARRVLAVAGDVEHPGLGLGQLRAELAGAVDEIYHTAASTRFDLDLDEARRVNRDGLWHLVSFAREARVRGGLRRFHHVSTAYSVGSGADERGRPLFRNTYEQSKWEAEQLLDEVRGEIDVTCYRPSIIVGDSRDGRTPHFRVLYDPIKWVYFGGLEVMPCRPETRLDVVPVDYVSDAIVEIGGRHDSAGRTYRVTGGQRCAIAIDALAELVMRHLREWQLEVGEPLTPHPRLVSPDRLDELPPEEREQVEKMLDMAAGVVKGHLPYMLEEQVFEHSETTQALAGTGIECPPLATYARSLMRYACDRRFGTRR